MSIPTATRLVYWKDKFSGQPVRIDAAAFDPKVHQTEPWEAAKAAKGEAKDTKAK